MLFFSDRSIFCVPFQYARSYLNCLSQLDKYLLIVLILCVLFLVIYFENLKSLVNVLISRWRKIAGSAWLLLFTWANHVNSGITGWKIRYYSVNLLISRSLQASKLSFLKFNLCNGYSWDYWMFSHSDEHPIRKNPTL